MLRKGRKKKKKKKKRSEPKCVRSEEKVRGREGVFCAASFGCLVWEREATKVAAEREREEGKRAKGRGRGRRRGLEREKYILEG